MLLSGIAEAFVNDDTDKLPLSVMGAGDTFGEIGFLTEVPRTASVVARSECEVLVLSADFMERFLRTEPELGGKVLLNLSKELASRLTVATHRGLQAA